MTKVRSPRTYAEEDKQLLKVVFWYLYIYRHTMVAVYTTHIQHIQHTYTHKWMNKVNLKKILKGSTCSWVLVLMSWRAANTPSREVYLLIRPPVKEALSLSSFLHWASLITLQESCVWFAICARPPTHENLTLPTYSLFDKALGVFRKETSEQWQGTN